MRNSAETFAFCSFLNGGHEDQALVFSVALEG